jgi:exonuclease VII large subunit
VNAGRSVLEGSVRLSTELVSSVTDLTAKGIVSELEYKKRKLTALEQRQKLDSLNQQLAARQNQLTEVRSSLDLYLKGRRADAEERDSRVQLGAVICH